MRIKICGLTNFEDAAAAAEYGADALGFVFYRESPRAVEPAAVRGIIRRLPPFVTTVGVFANAKEEEVRSIVDRCGLDVIQLQGDEPPEYCDRLGPRVIKAVRVRDRSSLDAMPRYAVKAFVLDTYRQDALGGTGRTFDWAIAREAKRHGRIILAGGLTPANVRQAIELVQPGAVDVSSGVEISMGKKDSGKIRQFIEEARAAFDSSPANRNG